MGKLTIGDYTYGEPIRRGHGNTITIGKFCSIAEGVIIDGGFNHNIRFVSTYPFSQKMNRCAHIGGHPLIKGDVNIGNDVWIGEGAVIMSGVTIGDGAVIGMRCIVSKDVFPYEVVVGAPQKVLKKRFEEQQIKDLLNIKWWDWELSKIIENAHLLQSGNIDTFINKFKDE